MGDADSKDGVSSTRGVSSSRSDSQADSKPAVRLIGRYALLGKLASGGMATVHVGRLLGPVGFTRMVAIKRLHPEYARDPEFVSMFLDEARLAAKISHPNVVSTLDVVATGGELFLVMEYLQGQSLSWLIKNATKSGTPIPPRIVAAVMSGCLQGLHAAHEARDEHGLPLNIVHRDVSPQNVMIGADGMARVLDFGVAKAAGRLQHTREGHIKGKLAYMSPEQLQTDFITRQADIYAAAVVIWEALTSQRLFKAETETATLAKILSGPVPLPSQAAPWVPTGYDAAVMRGLERDADRRYKTAREFALALERCGGIASHAEVSDWLEHVAGRELADRAARIAAIEMSAGLTKNQQVSGLAEAIAAAAPPIDEENSSSVVIRAAKAAAEETKPALFDESQVKAPDLEDSLTMPVDTPPVHDDPIFDPHYQTRVDRPHNMLGEGPHGGDGASQLSNISVSVARKSLPPTSRPKTLLAAALVGLAAALVGAGLWLTTARLAETPTITPAAAARPTESGTPVAPRPVQTAPATATQAAAPTPAPAPSPAPAPATATTTARTTATTTDAAEAADAGSPHVAHSHSSAPSAAPAPHKKSSSPFDSLGGRE